MSNKLSYSAINKHQFCQQAYFHHYKNKYRPIEISSALPFGSALGKTFEYILNPSSKTEALKDKEVTPYEVFDYHWRYQEINKVLTNIEEYEHIAYSKYDLDKDLADTPYQSLKAKGHLIITTFINEFLPLVEHVYSTEEKTELANDLGDVNVGYADAVVKLKDYYKPVIIDFKTAARPYEEDSVKTSIQLSSHWLS